MRRKTLVITSVCMTAMLCFAVPQKNITKKTYGSVIADKVLAVDDGLIIRCNINQWPAIIGADISVRINGVVPKLAGDKIKDEKTQKDVKNFIADTLTTAKVIILTNIKRGRDFSIIADIITDGDNLADMLVEKNLALKVIDNVNDQQKTEDQAKNKLSNPDEIVIEDIVIDDIVIEEIVIETGFSYLASKNSKVFHHHTCRQAGRISEKNITRFETKNAAIQTGRRPCKTCKP